VVWCESVWLQRAVSSTGAIGVCQIEPQTARYANIAMAAQLHQLVLQANGNANLAMGAYIQRLSSIARRGMLPETRALEHGT
jgi:soluble lytic murein transglycosylase-like protein